MTCVVLQSEGLECRHNSLMCVLVFMALWPAQHLPALDFHERASVCLSAGFAVLRLGHMEQDCLCVREHAPALGQTYARVSRVHVCFLSRARAWYGVACDCARGSMVCLVLQSERLDCRHSSLVYVLVCLALWPAQLSSDLDFPRARESLSERWVCRVASGTYRTNLVLRV